MRLLLLCLLLTGCGSESPSRNSIIRYSAIDSYTDEVMVDAAAFLPVPIRVVPGYPFHLHLRYALPFENRIAGHAEICSLSGGVTIAKEGEQDEVTHLKNVLVVAHELGHMLGASHTTEGIMRSGVSFSHTAFSETSIKQIEECLG